MICFLYDHLVQTRPESLQLTNLCQYCVASMLFLTGIVIYCFWFRFSATGKWGPKDTYSHYWVYNAEIGNCIKSTFPNTAVFLFEFENNSSSI